MIAMKKLTLFLFASMCSFFAFSQQVKYGDNSAVGKYYDVRGIKMYVEVYGEGKPLLLLHGNGGSMNAFSQTIPYFSKKYQVIAVDSRAQGKTVDTKDSLSFEMMADDFSWLRNRNPEMSPFTRSLRTSRFIAWAICSTSTGALTILFLSSKSADISLINFLRTLI